MFQVAVELATVPELAPSWNVAGGDVRQLTRADVFDSATMSLFQELSNAGASDYIVVDLGRGNQWLGSRLYVFVVVLKRMRGLEPAFTATKGEETGIFVGLADPSRVRWRLAIAYPWLESAFARAYAHIAPPAASPPGTRLIVSDEGALEPWTANNLVRAFLTELQYPPSPPPTAGQPVSPIVPGPPEWIELPGSPAGQPPIWERAAWLSVSTLEQIVGPSGLVRESAFADSPIFPTGSAHEPSPGDLIGRCPSSRPLVGSPGWWIGVHCLRRLLADTRSASSSRNPDT